MGFVPGFKEMEKSISRIGGKPGSSGGNTCRNLLILIILPYSPDLTN